MMSLSLLDGRTVVLSQTGGAISYNQYGFIMWMNNSVVPDQLASSESICSGSTLFSIGGLEF